MSEWGFIEILRRELGRGPRARVALDIGDDAAVLRRAPLDTVLSVDASVEGVHFRRTWTTWDVLGARAFEAAISDLAAMGSDPVAALVALGLPAGTRERDVAALARGIARAARPARRGRGGAGRAPRRSRARPRWPRPRARDRRSDRPRGRCTRARCAGARALRPGVRVARGASSRRVPPLARRLARGTRARARHHPAGP